jgi:hypothetical protein
LLAPWNDGIDANRSKIERIPMPSNSAHLVGKVRPTGFIRKLRATRQFVLIPKSCIPDKSGKTANFISQRWSAPCQRLRRQA